MPMRNNYNINDLNENTMKEEAMKNTQMKNTQNSRMKCEIEALLRSTQREGVENLIELLDKHGFYDFKPRHTRHHKWHGGLAQHSLGTYYFAKSKGYDVPEDSLILATLLHDLCKFTALLPGLDRGRHGHRSKAMLIALGVDLTDRELFAIRYHMRSGRSSDKLYMVLREADKADAKNPNNKYMLNLLNL